MWQRTVKPQTEQVPQLSYHIFKALSLTEQDRDTSNIGLVIVAVLPNRRGIHCNEEMDGRRGVS